jgi:hypothetical protein
VRLARQPEDVKTGSRPLLFLIVRVLGVRRVVTARLLNVGLALDMAGLARVLVERSPCGRAAVFGFTAVASASDVCAGVRSRV